MRLLGKKAIVTGASKSIGRAIALGFAKEGADVVISYQGDKKSGESTLHDILRLGTKIKLIQADFTNGVEPFFNEALNFLHEVDIIVNNAAAYDTTPFLECSIKTFEHLFKVGVLAPMHLIQLSAKHMIKNGTKGSIINISSIVGSRPYPNRVCHSNAKAALNMLTQSTALELGAYSIRVNAIAPGQTGDETKNADTIPLKRIGVPNDYCEAAIFLASEASCWMTGQIMTIDGGQSLSF